MATAKKTTKKTTTTKKSTSTKAKATTAAKKTSTKKTPAAKPAAKKTATKTTAKKPAAQKPAAAKVAKSPAKEAPVKKAEVAKQAASTPKAAKPAPAPVRTHKQNPAKNPPIGHGVGRRKKSVARVWLRRGSGKITVNDKDVDTFFTVYTTRRAARMPFLVDASAGKYDAVVNVYGGGTTGQADAIKMGIARALVNHDDSFKKIMRQHGLLTRDARMVERKKPGQRGARRKFQFVKR